MDFNRQQLVDNIGSLIQQKGMKIGEVESAIGISTGYLSRLSKDGNNSIPATDVTWKLARHLGVSTDALISGDYSAGTDNLSVLKRFLKKLIVQTVDGVIDWIPVTTKYVNAVLKGDEDSFFLVKQKDKDYGVPQFEPEDNFSEANMTYSCYHRRKIVSAASPLDFAWMTGDGFKAKLGENRWVYLFPMCVSFDTGTPAGSIEQDYFEMYFLDASVSVNLLTRKVTQTATSWVSAAGWNQSFPPQNMRHPMYERLVALAECGEELPPPLGRFLPKKSD